MLQIMLKFRRKSAAVLSIFSVALILIGAVFFFLARNKIFAKSGVGEKSRNVGGNTKISVIIPFYNAEKVLDKCLKSVRNQTLREIEIICVNDASPDNCKKILNAHAKEDVRLTVINQEQNKGACAARNRGLDVAKGEYICFCDDDDTMALSALEVRYNKAKEEKADILYDDMPYNKVLMGPIYDHLQVHVWSGVYRTEFLNKNNIKFYEPIKQYGEDHVFNLMCTPKANKIVCIKDNLYSHVRSTAGSDPKEIKEFPERHRMAVRKIYDCWNKSGYFKHSEARVAFLRWAHSVWRWVIKVVNKSYVDAIGPELLKDNVLNLLDKGARDVII